MHECKICGKKYDRQQGLAGHIRATHSDIPNGPQKTYRSKYTIDYIISSISKETLEEALKTAISLVDLKRKLNLPGTNRGSKPFKLLKARIGDLGLVFEPIKHSQVLVNKNCKTQIYYKKPFELLKRDPARKKRLIEECGTFCWICSQKDWMGKPIPLELDHIDGNPANSERTNLRIVCPNCHAQTDTYKGKNIGRNIGTKRQEILLKHPIAKYRTKNDLQAMQISSEN